MDLSLASLIDPAGVVIAAGLVTGLVQLIKTSFPVIDARVSGAAMAFVLSAILYLLVLFGAGTILSLNWGFVVFMAWVSCATSAVGIKASVTHVQAQRAETATDAVPKE